MKKHKKLLNIDELKIGMITAHEITSENTLLLGKGLPITQQIIDKLTETYFYNKIEIYFDEETHTDNNFNKENTIEEIEESFLELSSNIQSIFDTMVHFPSSNIEDIRQFISRIQEELISTSSIIKNIVLYGSGQDAIYRHSVNVAALSTILGRWVGFTKQELTLLAYSAILHDFGKIKIDEKILNKPSTLTSKEFEVIKKHPVVAYKYLQQIKFLNPSVSLGVLMHHEKADGSGYPFGLKDDKIHKFAKIIAISDMFDAINSDRLYKKSMKPLEALALIQEQSLGKLDYEYCNIFLTNVIQYYIGERVLLNNGSLCKIVQIDIKNIERPLLFDDNNFIDLKTEKNLYIEKFIF